MKKKHHSHHKKMHDHLKEAHHHAKKHSHHLEKAMKHSAMLKHEKKEGKLIHELEGMHKGKKRAYHEKEHKEPGHRKRMIYR